MIKNTILKKNDTLPRLSYIKQYVVIKITQNNSNSGQKNSVSLVKQSFV